jgi:uncharacterized protein (TIGR00266 family)
MLGSVPPIPPSGASSSRRADVIDYAIRGHEMQFVEVELDPGESAIAEAGAMMFKDAAVDMDTVLGDPSKPEQGFFGRLAAAGKRLLTGNSLFLTVFTHQGQGKARVAFAAPYPGTILAFDLGERGGALVVQRDAFLCAAKGVSIGVFLQQRIMTGLFGGDGFIMQKLEGDGLAFVHVGGTLVERELAPGEELDIDAGCVAAMTPTVDFDVVRAGSVKSMIFGGQGMFFARLRGPGTVWIQSLPFSRLAGRILANLPRAAAAGGTGFAIGDMLGGDSGQSSGD